MTNTFQGHRTSLSSPGDYHFEITPDDSNDLAVLPRSIRIGGGGVIVVRDKKDVDISYTVAAGEVLIFRGARVLETGTTATDIVGWY